MGCIYFETPGIMFNLAVYKSMIKNFIALYKRKSCSDLDKLVGERVAY